VSDVAMFSSDPKSRAPVLRLRQPYLLFIGDVADPVVAKTAFGLRDWARDRVVGQWRTDPLAVDLGLPELTPEAAKRAGARSVVIGAAPSGGALPGHWVAALTQAALAGLDVVSGLHAPLGDHEVLRAAAHKQGVALVDVRTPPANIPIGTGEKRSGKRLLTVGADSAIGKKYAALAIAREMALRGWDHHFRATGQTGIMIAGGGIPIDTVVSDFLAGAAEILTPAAPARHWDVIEGQGSLFHPSYAGVSLGLLHGSQPDAIVYCHSLTRREIDGCPGFPIPEISEGVRRNLEAARLTNPAVFCAGVSVNTAHLSEHEAKAQLGAIEAQTALPAMDPLRFGAGAIVDALAARDGLTPSFPREE